MTPPPLVIPHGDVILNSSVLSVWGRRGSSSSYDCSHKLTTHIQCLMILLIINILLNQTQLEILKMLRFFIKRKRDFSLILWPWQIPLHLNKQTMNSVRIPRSCPSSIWWKFSEESWRVQLGFGYVLSLTVRLQVHASKNHFDQ